MAGWHLLTIFVAGLGESYWGRHIPILWDWANFWQVNFRWNLYAPNPTHPFAIQVELWKNGQLQRVESWPRAGLSMDLDFGWRRLLYVSRFWMMRPDWAKRQIESYYCAREPYDEIVIEARGWILDSWETVLMKKKSLGVRILKPQDYLSEPQVAWTQVSSCMSHGPDSDR